MWVRILLQFFSIFSCKIRFFVSNVDPRWRHGNSFLWKIHSLFLESLVDNNLRHFGLKNYYGIISREDNSENEEISRIVIHWLNRRPFKRIVDITNLCYPSIAKWIKCFWLYFIILSSFSDRTTCRSFVSGIAFIF